MSFEDNSDLPGIPDRFVWEAFPEGQDGQRILMLNADVSEERHPSDPIHDVHSHWHHSSVQIALVRELDYSNLGSDGSVSCTFIGEGRCPHAARSLDFAAEYFLDNTKWLIDFHDVFTRMLKEGYTETGSCFGDLCYLSASRR